MSCRPKMQLPHPESWIAFEDLCWGLWKCIWRHEGTKKNGRRGQAQHGVDVFGRPGNGFFWAGVQCKGKDSYTRKELTTTEIKAESTKARSFDPRLTEYIIATTAPRDEALQRFARTLSDENVKAGWFSVDVCGWDDIVDLLYEHTPCVAAQYYPQVFGSEMVDFARELVGCLRTHQARTLPPSFHKEDFCRADDNGAGADEDLQDRPRDAPTPRDNQRGEALSPKDMQIVHDALYSFQQGALSLSSLTGAPSADITYTAIRMMMGGNGPLGSTSAGEDL